MAEFESTRHLYQQMEANENKLPEGFVSYDGTNDIGWNEQFGELCKYKGLHGELPPVRNDTNPKLGRWISSQRLKYWAGKMSAERIEILEKVGFKWMGGNIKKRQIHGGDPKNCRAVAAKMIFPQLSYRECLYLGGFTDEELDDGVDEKHTWRNNYVREKDKIVITIKQYGSRQGKRASSKKQIEELISILESEDNDRFERVFGQQSNLLPRFLNAAKHRETEKTVKPRRKRPAEELSEGSEQEDPEQELSDNELPP
jgi:succinate dehydrogenase flavin-adding protein (antitoxin of CptAB toxin-antitoxin module)